MERLKLFASLLAIKVDTYIFDVVVDCILIFLAILFFCLWYNTIFVTYLSLSLVEVVLKLLTKSTFRYLRSFRNPIDGIITATLLIIVSVLLSRNNSTDQDVVFANNFTIR